MQIRPVSIPLGAEITDVDLATVTDDQAQQIHDALMQYGVVFFRDQVMTPKQHAAFAKRYGEVPKAQKASFGVEEEAPEVSTLVYDRERPPNVNHYHPDGLFREHPEFASVLYAKEVPEIGGDTIFVSGYAAYEALSDRMKQYLDGVYAQNNFMHLHSRPSKKRSWQGESGKGMAAVRDANPPVEHPVVRTHPVTGKKSLYICESFTTYLVDVPDANLPNKVGGLRLASLTEPDAIRAVVPELARLRIGVFREFPYLYDGSLDYEREYLEVYATTPGAIVVTACDPADADRIVGAATGMPLAGEHEELLAAFRQADMPIDDYYYCAESVLDAAYRGRGIGHAFFDRREAQARALGFSQCCFLAVDRPADHPRRPADYRPLDEFWQKRGYRLEPGFKASFSWQDLDETAQSPKSMSLWRKRI